MQPRAPPPTTRSRIRQAQRYRAVRQPVETHAHLGCFCDDDRLQGLAVLAPHTRRAFVTDGLQLRSHRHVTTYDAHRQSRLLKYNSCVTTHQGESESQSRDRARDDACSTLLCVPALSSQAGQESTLAAANVRAAHAAVWWHADGAPLMCTIYISIYMGRCKEGRTHAPSSHQHPACHTPGHSQHSTNMTLGCYSARLCIPPVQTY